MRMALPQNAFDCRLIEGLYVELFEGVTQKSAGHLCGEVAVGVAADAVADDGKAIVWIAINGVFVTVFVWPNLGAGAEMPVLGE